MMKRRIITLLLAAVLLVSLTLPIDKPLESEHITEQIQLTSISNIK